jgi:hypothetical protein
LFPPPIHHLSAVQMPFTYPRSRGLLMNVYVFALLLGDVRGTVLLWPVKTETPQPLFDIVGLFSLAGFCGVF